MADNNENDRTKGHAGKIRSPHHFYGEEEKKTTSSITRKIMTPVKRGTISRSAIRKAVREIKAARVISYAT